MPDFTELWEIEELMNMNCSSDFILWVIAAEHKQSWYWLRPDNQQQRNLYQKYHRAPQGSDSRAALWQGIPSTEIPPRGRAFGNILAPDPNPDRRFSRWVRRPALAPGAADPGEFADPDTAVGYGEGRTALICDFFYPGGGDIISSGADSNWGHSVHLVQRRLSIPASPTRSVRPGNLQENIGRLLLWSKDDDGYCVPRPARSRLRGDPEPWRIVGFVAVPPEGKEFDERRNPLAPVKFVLPKDLENLLLDNCEWEFAFFVSAVTKVRAWYWASMFYQNNEEIVEQTWRPPRQLDNDWGLVTPGYFDGESWPIAFGHAYSHTMFEWLQGPPPSNVYGYGFVVSSDGTPESCAWIPDNHENWGVSERMLGFISRIPGGIIPPFAGKFFSSRTRGIYAFIPEYAQLLGGQYEWVPFYRSPGWNCTVVPLGQVSGSKDAYRISGFLARRPPLSFPLLPGQKRRPFNNRHNPWANSRQKFGPPPGEEEICPYYKEILEPPAKDSGCGLIERKMKCCKELTELLKKVAAQTDEVHKSLDAAEMAAGGEVPAFWTNPLASAEEVIQIPNYREFMIVLAKLASAKGFQPFSLPLDPDKPDEEPQQEVLSLSAALKSVLEFLVDVEDDQDTLLNLNIRLAGQVAQMAQMLAVQGRNIANIQDYLFPTKMESAKFPLRFNPFCGLEQPENQALLADDSLKLSQLLDMFLSDKEVDVVQYAPIYRRTLEARLLELISILQAVSAASGNIPIQPEDI